MYVNQKIFPLQSLHPQTEKEVDKVILFLYLNFNAHVIVCGYLVTVGTQHIVV